MKGRDTRSEYTASCCSWEKNPFVWLNHHRSQWLRLSLRPSQRRTTGPRARPVDSRDPVRRWKASCWNCEALPYDHVYQLFKVLHSPFRHLKNPFSKSITKPKGSPDCTGTHWLSSSLAANLLKAISSCTNTDNFTATSRTWCAPATSFK